MQLLYPEVSCLCECRWLISGNDAGLTAYATSAELLLPLTKVSFANQRQTAANPPIVTPSTPATGFCVTLDAAATPSSRPGIPYSRFIARKTAFMELPFIYTNWRKLVKAAGFDCRLSRPTEPVKSLGRRFSSVHGDKIFK